MILVALGSSDIFNKIKNKYLDDVYDEDINEMEDVIEFASKNILDQDIIITRDDLKGNMSKEIYLKQLKIASKNCKIIVIANKIDEFYRKFLYSNEIFDIIDGKNMDLNVLQTYIENKGQNVYKNEDILNVKRVIPKQFITVFGTSGSGKSYISSNLAKIISKDIGMKVALVDMDLQNPAIDIYNNLNGSSNMLSNIVEDIDRGIDMDTILDSRVSSVSDTKVSYITNNATIYECQNKLNSYYYEKIYSALNKRFDSIIVDLPASPFIDIVQYSLNMSSKIYFVVNPNYISIRQAIKYLDLMTKLWQVDKEKIAIIINKFQKCSLDKYQIESFFSEYRIIDWVNYSVNIEGYVNGTSFHMDYGLNKENIYKDLGVVEVQNKSRNLVTMLLSKAERGRV